MVRFLIWRENVLEFIRIIELFVVQTPNLDVLKIPFFRKLCLPKKNPRFKKYNIHIIDIPQVIGVYFVL